MFFFLVFTTSLSWFEGQSGHQGVSAPSRSQLRGIKWKTTKEMLNVKNKLLI
jgi:hypothetical protein